jgi:hypothetical protein
MVNVEWEMLNVEWIAAPRSFNIQHSAFTIQHFSTSSDSPIPPLMHSVASPSLFSRDCKACNSVVVMRAPVQPMG